MTKSAALLLVLVFLSALCIVAALPAKAGSKTIVVPDDYSTIQGAINAASIGDTIFVRSGTYHGTVIVDKMVSLVGENKQSTIIDGSGMNNVINVIADYVNIAGFKVMNGAENGIYLDSSTGATIKENIILNANRGIYLQRSHKNIISNNIISKNFLNIMLTSSSDNVFLNNMLGQSVGGLWMSASHNNCFDNNKIEETTGFSGLYIDNCTNNLFRRNEISFSQTWGMYLAFYSSGNVFSENTFSNNRRDFIIHYCAYNTFCHNNFFNASESDNQDCINTWDNGYPSGGNYWNDYNGTDADGDGIGDTPYTINTLWPLDTYDYGPDHDFYPLMTPYEVISPPDPQSQIISPENKTYTTNSVALTLSQDELTSGTTYRLDGQLGIAAGNTTLNWLSNGKHVLTTYAADLNGSLVASDTVCFIVDSIVNEPKPPNERTYDYDLPSIVPPDPVVKVLSPTQGEIYTTNSSVLNFTVTEPEEYSELKTKISHLRYVLDPSYNEALHVYAGWIEVAVAPGSEKTKSYSINLSEVSDGPHYLVVSAEAVCTEIPRYEVIVLNSEAVNFAVKTTENTNSSSTSSSPTPQPTATSPPKPNLSPTPQPTPTPNPTSTPSPSSIPQETENRSESKPYPATLVIAAAASMVVICTSLLVYFGLRKKV